MEKNFSSHLFGKYSQYLKQDKLEDIGNIKNSTTKYISTHVIENQKEDERYNKFIYNSSNKVFSFIPGEQRHNSLTSFSGNLGNDLAQYNSLTIDFKNIERDFEEIKTDNQILQNLTVLNIENEMSRNVVARFKKLILPNLRVLTIKLKDDEALEELLNDTPEFIWGLIKFVVEFGKGVLFKNKIYNILRLPFASFLKFKTNTIENINKTNFTHFKSRILCSVNCMKILEYNER